jgi:protoheme ferro-lyase
MSKLAVVLLNLGGPDSQEAVEPFLYNLFSDPAIIRLPQPLRWALARLISRRRAPVARAIYAHLGGGSPLLPNTQAQADMLQQALHAAGDDAKVFIDMRYWSPALGRHRVRGRWQLMALTKSCCCPSIRNIRRRRRNPRLRPGRRRRPRPG